MSQDYEKEGSETCHKIVNEKDHRHDKRLCITRITDNRLMNNNYHRHVTRL